MPRYSVDLTGDEVAMAKAWAKQEERTMASLMRCIFKAALRVGNLASIQRQNDVTSASLPRQNSAKVASLQQSPSRARASTERIGKERSLSSKEILRPADGIEGFAAELQGILNAAGCRHNLHDHAAARAVYDRMNPTSPALGDPASEDQIREMVTGAAQQWGGTQYASGLDLLGLLDQRFWTRFGKMGAAGRGKAQASTGHAARRDESERRSRASAQRLADESKARWRAEQAAKAAEAAPAPQAEGQSQEPESLAARGASQEEQS